MSAAPSAPLPPDQTGPVPMPPPESTGKQAGKAVVRGLRDAFSPVIRFIDVFGSHVLLAARAMSWLPRRPFRMANYLEAAEYIGFGSLPIVLLVGTFTGMV